MLETLPPEVVALIGERFKFYEAKYRTYTPDRLMEHMAETWKRQQDVLGLLYPCPLGRAWRAVSCTRLSKKKREQATALSETLLIKMLAAGSLLEEHGYRIAIVDLRGISDLTIYPPETRPPP